MSPIRVTVESEPHTEDLSEVLLNRPAPSRGSFMIAQRLDRALWQRMKDAGAWYLSAEELEDMDIFGVPGGWRYSLDALYVLLASGHEIEIYGETIRSAEQLVAFFSAESRAARKVAEESRLRDEAAAKRRALADGWHEREAAGAAYAIWQAETLGGLVATSVGPDRAAGQYGAGGPWEMVARFPKGTPGTWYDTGDVWSRNPGGVLRRDYGNACQWYATQETVDGWVLACDDGSAAYARHVLEYHGYGVHGSDVADRLVALRGLDHYLERARQEVWLLIANGSQSRRRDVAAHYGMPVGAVAMRKYDHELVERIRELLSIAKFDRQAPRGVGQTADGRWYATTDHFNGGGWRELTAAQCDALGLSMAPPSPAPELPPARPLPGVDETAEQNARFSAIFSA